MALSFSEDKFNEKSTPHQVWDSCKVGNNPWGHLNEYFESFCSVFSLIKTHNVRAIPVALTGFPILTGFLNDFSSDIVN